MSNQFNIVALLPLKASSSRIKGKNFRKLYDKPLFAWMLDTLLSLDEVDKVVINTDARQILIENGLVESERVLIRDRKPEICGDDVSMNKILGDDINAIPSDIYLMTHVTNPFISDKSIRGAISAFKEARKSGAADSLFTVNRFQTRFYRKDGSPINHDLNKLVPTQDLEPWFEENSNLYLFTKDSFKATDARIGLKPVLYETPKIESIDIDEEEDWQIVAALAESMSTGNHMP